MERMVPLSQIDDHHGSILHGRRLGQAKLADPSQCLSALLDLSNLAIIIPTPLYRRTSMFYLPFLRSGKGRAISAFALRMCVKSVGSRI